MWIANTAATAMMLPIMDSVLEEMFKEKHLPANSKTVKLAKKAAPPRLDDAYRKTSRADLRRYSRS